MEAIKSQRHRDKMSSKGVGKEDNGTDRRPEMKRKKTEAGADQCGQNEILINRGNQF